eukprot:Skav236721  [mRNA]  locus=scaffold2096:184896:191720:+ [translate_table: standard]
MMDPADAEEETIEQLPAELKESDELMGAHVSKQIDGKESTNRNFGPIVAAMRLLSVFKGMIEDIEVGQISRERLYRVRSCLLEREVREVLVALTNGENDQTQGQVLMKRPASRSKALEVVAEEDVEMGAPEEEPPGWDIMKKPAGRAKGKAKAKAKAVDPVVEEEAPAPAAETAEPEKAAEEEDDEVWTVSVPLEATNGH